MERDSGSWFHHQHAHLLSPSQNLSAFPYDIGWLKTEPVLKNPLSIEDFHQTLAPVLNSATKGKLLASTVDFKQKEESPILDAAPTEKRFLVFDQSGGKTTLIYSSGFRSPVQCGTCPVPKPRIIYNDNNITKGDTRIGLHPLRPIINEHEENNSRDDVVRESEMREDSEELDALLYSDSYGDFSEEDEETSTGHSPSTMTDNGTQDFVEETGEEVDNFAGPNKRQKLLDGFYGATIQKETRSSVKTNEFSGLEGEAESISRNSNLLSTEGIASLSGTKRKGRIQETMSIMQSIFPSLNGKGAIDAIDEAIHYLRSLKMKAKALGLDTL